MARPSNIPCRFRPLFIMLIAQISDFHVSSKDKLVFGLVDSRSLVQNAITAVLRLSPLPDVVLITGDLADGPDAEVYAFVAEELKRLPMPVYLIPGNHDSRSVMSATFPEIPTIEKERFIAYSVEDYAVRLIGLDSTVEGKHTAEFCERRAVWLEQSLAARPDAPTLLFVHHPPIESGVVAMDFLGFDWTRQLKAVVERHRQVIRVACGHHHRSMTASWAGTIVTVAPSTSHQFPSRFGTDVLPGFASESPGMLLHYWNGHSLVTHTVPIDPVTTHDFFVGRPDLWQATMESLRNGEAHPSV
jgi:Icc protein